MSAGYNAFLPVWKWKIPEDNKKKSKQNIERTVSICRNFQYILFALTILSVFSFERSRQLIFSSKCRSVTQFVMECLVHILFAYTLGFKRLPTNYISFIIIKTFATLDKNFLPRTNIITSDSKARLLGTSSFHRLWSLVQITPEQVKVVPSANHYVRNTGIVLAFIGAMWLCGKYTKISLSKYTSSVVILLNIATSLAAVLLVSTFAFDAVPEIIPAHLKFCELWTLFALTTLIFAMAFLLERLRAVTGTKQKLLLQPRLEWETFILMLALSITLSYIPAIHSSFSYKNVLSNKTARLWNLLVPTEVVTFFKPIVSFAYDVGERVVKTCTDI